MSRVCFISNFDLTILQHELAKRLEVNGHDIVWMTTNPKWTRWLTENGVDRDAICELVYPEKPHLTDDERTQLNAEIAAMERRVGHQVSLALMADKFVRSKRWAHLDDFTISSYRDMRNWLESRQVDVVVGEPSNLHELIASMICRDRGLRFLGAETMRIPSDRMLFRTSFTQADVYRPTRSCESGPAGDELLQQWRDDPPRPRYFAINNRKSIAGPAKIASTLKNRWADKPWQPKHHLTHWDFGNRLAVTGRQIINRALLSNRRYPELNQLSGRLAYYGLHVQPEASIDVGGPYVSDQPKLIADIRRSLPWDMTLVVKEHPNALGTKSLPTYRAIESLPRVVMIHPQTETKQILKRVDLVFTVTGTLAYEAGLRGVPAITFAPMFFGDLSTVHSVDNVCDLPREIHRAMSLKQSPEHDANVLEQLWQWSRPGYWTDPITDPSVLHPENLDLLVEAFAEAIDDPA